MRRWIVLLAVMELAALAVYAPGVLRSNFVPRAALYPECTVHPERDVDHWIDPAPNADVTRPARATAELVAYAVLGACWLVAIYWLSRSDGRLDRRTLTVVLAGATLIAVTLWGLPPTSSDDSYRYRWEGLSATHGCNPYVVKPDECAKLRDSHRPLYSATGYRWRPSIYPPVCLAMFVGNALVGNTLLGLRVLMLATEALAIWAVIELLRRRGLGAGWAVAVALCPLVIFETHLDAHIELIPVALTLAAVALLDRGRWQLSAGAFALAVSMKYLWPAIVAFLMLGQLARQRKLLAGAGMFVLTTLICWLPAFLMDWSAAPDRGEDSWMPTPMRYFLKAPGEFLNKYEHNATFYKVLVVQFPVGSPAPKLIAAAVLAGGIALLIWRRRWQMDLPDVALALGLALLVSPVCHPWYFLWLLPALLAIGRGELWPTLGPPAWAILALAMVPALHEFIPGFFRTNHPDPFEAIPWLIAAAVTPLLATAWVARLRVSHVAQPPSAVGISL